MLQPDRRQSPELTPQAMLARIASQVQDARPYSSDLGKGTLRISRSGDVSVGLVSIVSSSGYDHLSIKWKPSETSGILELVHLEFGGTKAGLEPLKLNESALDSQSISSAQKIVKELNQYPKVLTTLLNEYIDMMAEGRGLLDPNLWLHTDRVERAVQTLLTGSTYTLGESSRMPGASRGGTVALRAAFFSGSDPEKTLVTLDLPDIAVTGRDNKPLSVSREISTRFISGLL